MLETSSPGSGGGSGAGGALGHRGAVLAQRTALALSRAQRLHLVLSEPSTCVAARATAERASAERRTDLLVQALGIALLHLGQRHIHEDLEEPARARAIAIASASA